MDKEQVKRIIALSRQIMQYQSMYKKGVLTAEEATLAMSGCEREIAHIRSQGVLALEGSGNPPEKAKKA